ncbi:unnamed protein product [Allacma fusca]|uniref:Ig-like domain-containing protein n=1 Tax=Allacma fusca TaxID=39272 RepID=A0A8J2Q3X0_9HEXA|nr:unnamed protein product [Allacma fusca]
MSSFGFLIRSANLGYRSILWRNIILVLSLLVTGCTSRNGLYDTEAPNFFTHEPPRFNYFTNDKGLLLQCIARGSPRPTITWMNAVTSEPLSNINGLRQNLANGSIFYPPFSVSFYRSDIHNASIYCLAGNAAGQIRSRDIAIRAVINQRHDIRLEDIYTTKGNDALLKCVIPEAVKDFVSVTSWIKDSTYNIFPHSGGGSGRYFMVPSGELLIEGASANDSTSTFQCRTVNRLTGKTLESETLARIRLQGGERESEPRILSQVTELHFKEGETGVLLCLSEGYPPPSQGWLKADGFGGFESVRQTERIRIRRSSVIIENLGIQDTAVYICNATNRHGSARHQIHLVVQSPLAVQVLPPVMTVDVGKSAEFSCWTNNQGIGNSNLGVVSGGGGVNRKDSNDGATKIRWFKNGKELTASTRVAFSPSGDKLRIAYIQREDMGMIQCMVLSQTDMSQAAAQLRLGDASPHFTYRFIEQTLQPGQSVSLKCTASGNPTPRITWLLDGFIPPISESIS